MVSSDERPVSWWKRRVPLWALILAALIGVGLGAGASSAPDDKPETAASASSTTEKKSTTTTVKPTTTTHRPTTTTAPPYTPVATDFTIAVITTEKSCFGSAGCNVTFTIDVKYVGARLPDPSETYTVIYDINGGEDPHTDSFEVTGDEISYTKEDTISTTSSDAVLTAVPTAVIT